VEFALILPVLLLLVLGIIEFGRAFNTQTILSGAARDGVRVMALQNNAAAARSATKAAAAPIVTLTDAQVTIATTPSTTPITCLTTGTNPSAQATVTVKYPMAFLTGFFGTSITLTGKGVMRCNG